MKRQKYKSKNRVKDNKDEEVKTIKQDGLVQINKDANPGIHED